MFSKMTGIQAGALVAAAVLAAPAMAQTDVGTEGGLGVTSGDFSFEFGGRIQADAAFYDEDLTPLNDGTEFRRARLFAQGVFAPDWGYKAQFDFADNDLSTKDLYIRYNGLPRGTLYIGQYKQPFSLEELTSSKYITFMERALPNIFATSRRVGIGWEYNQGGMHFSSSVYGQEAGAGDSGDEGFGVGARFAFLPVSDDGTLVHLGVAAALENPEDNDSGAVRLRARPESHVTNTRLVDTGTLTGVDDITKVGLEAAANFGPISLQAEYMMSSLNTSTVDYDFGGHYVYASWFPTGETRPYKNGAFGRVRPKGDHGAWELAVRYSGIELDDGDVFGGEEENLTLGVNYYVNSHLRFMFNYIMVETEQTDPVTSAVTHDDPKIIQFRAAMDF